MSSVAHAADFTAPIGVWSPGRALRSLLSALLVALVLLTQSFAPSAYAATTAPAVTPATADPTMAAHMDADADSNGILWFGAGCLLGVIGIIVAYVIEPTPPPSRLMGKPADYVTVYSGAYQKAGRWEQTKSAMWGCGTGAVAGIVIYVAALSAVIGGTN
jgi:hypothetical protein